jgi:hypothetical protein
MRSRLLAACLVLVLAACGGGEDVATTTSGPERSTTTTTEATTTTSTSLPSTTTTASLPPTTRAITTTTTQPIDVSFEGGVVTGPERVTATVGDQVSTWVLSDVDAEIHVHGYDLFFEATAGIPVEITLTANVPGIFEVEVEGSHTLLFELEVTG